MTTMDTANDATAELVSAIGSARERFGEGLLADRRRLSGLLSDLAPERRREIRVLMTALDDGVPADLKRVRADQIGLEVQRLAGRLAEGHAIQVASARWAVETWARVLGIDTAGPDVAGAEAGVNGEGADDLTWGDEPAAHDGDDDWVGFDGAAAPATPVHAASQRTPPPAAVVHQPASPPVFHPPLARSRGGRIWNVIAQVLAVVFLLLVGLIALGIYYADDPQAPQPVAAAPEPVAEAPEPAPVPVAADPAPAPVTEPAPVPAQAPAVAPPTETGYPRLATETGEAFPPVPLGRGPGNSFEARFEVPVGQRTVRFQANVHPDNGTAAWIASPDGTTAAPSSVSIGTVILSDVQPDGSRWLASQADWTLNDLDLPRLCLVAAADAAGRTALDGGEICLMDEACAETIACGRITSR